jgi:hypothetical protein
VRLQSRNFFRISHGGKNKGGIWKRKMKICMVEDLIPILQLSKKAVRAYIAQGKPRGRKVGKKYLVTEEALGIFKIRIRYPDIKA